MLARGEPLGLFQSAIVTAGGIISQQSTDLPGEGLRRRAARMTGRYWGEANADRSQRRAVVLAVVATLTLLSAMIFVPLMSSGS